MPLVLGIDAAWTARGSSGVALLACGDARTAVIAAAPSYASFIAHARGETIAYHRPIGGVPNVDELLDAARTLGGADVDCIALDLPMSNRAITERRACDNAVSRAFGARGAAVHSPTAGRPDAAVTAMVSALRGAGYELAARRDVTQPLLEVFPLAALVQLLGTAKREHRPKYKAAKTRTYWPQHRDREPRIDELMAEWQRIREALGARVGDLGIPFPSRERITTFAALKPYEDAFDAVVCAWVGTEYLAGHITRYPEDQSVDAIWIP